MKDMDGVQQSVPLSHTHPGWRPRTLEARDLHPFHELVSVLERGKGPVRRRLMRDQGRSARARAHPAQSLSPSPLSSSLPISLSPPLPLSLLPLSLSLPQQTWSRFLTSHSLRYGSSCFGTPRGYGFHPLSASFIAGSCPPSQFRAMPHASRQGRVRPGGTECAFLDRICR
jgi:hypothetical protein